MLGLFNCKSPFLVKSKYVAQDKIHFCSVFAHATPVIVTFLIISIGFSNADIICYTGVIILISLVNIYVFLNEIPFTR